MRAIMKNYIILCLFVLSMGIMPMTARSSNITLIDNVYHQYNDLVIIGAKRTGDNTFYFDRKGKIYSKNHFKFDGDFCCTRYGIYLCDNSSKSITIPQYSKVTIYQDEHTRKVIIINMEHIRQIEWLFSKETIKTLYTWVVHPVDYCT